MAHSAKERSFAAPERHSTTALFDWFEKVATGLLIGTAAARAWRSEVELAMTRAERAEDLRRRFFDG